MLPDATLTYEVKLDTFEKSKESWQLDPSQKLEQVGPGFRNRIHIRSAFFKSLNLDPLFDQNLTNFWKN